MPAKFARHATLVSRFFHSHPTLLPLCTFVTTAAIRRAANSFRVDVVRDAARRLLSSHPDAAALNPSDRSFDLAKHQSFVSALVAETSGRAGTSLRSQSAFMGGLLSLLCDGEVRNECLGICADYVAREGGKVMEEVARREGREEAAKGKGEGGRFEGWEGDEERQNAREGEDDEGLERHLEEVLKSGELCRRFLHKSRLRVVSNVENVPSFTTRIRPT